MAWVTPAFFGYLAFEDRDNNARMFLLFSSNHPLDLLGIPFISRNLEGKGDRDERD